MGVFGLLANEIGASTVKCHLIGPSEGNPCHGCPKVPKLMTIPAPDEIHFAPPKTPWNDDSPVGLRPSTVATLRFARGHLGPGQNPA